jgi:hypothetical protein
MATNLRMFRPGYVPHAASTAPVLKLVKASITGATKFRENRQKAQ